MKHHLVHFLLSALFASTLHGQTTLRIRGSDTIGAKLMTSLAEAYKRQAPQISFDIGAEGSSTGFGSLASGSADIAMSSRKVKPDERTLCRSKGVKLHEIEFAWDMICVVVNRDNPVTAMTKKQLMRIFCGDVRDWSEIDGPAGTISVYTRNSSSGTYRDFSWMAMKDRHYGSHTQKMAGNEQIATEVGSNRLGIGYVGHAFSGARGIKVVSVDGSWPDPAHVKDYPLARPTYLYTNGEPQGAIRAFIDFCFSPKGRDIIKQGGFVPLSEK
ncbi:MAG: PstS family phosphate ABC transporter substrate-binding protein [Verrucomicrobiaceae bacterium]